MAKVSSSDVLVAGGGVVGLAVALELGRRGAEVTLLEREARVGRGATAAAAGMLAAAAESPSPGPFFDLAVRSATLWESWAPTLLQESGVDCEMEACGLLRVTTSADRAAELGARRSWQVASGLEVSPLMGPEELRHEVPGLGPDTVAGLLYPGVAHVHSHRVAEALAGAGRRAGVRLELGAGITDLRSDSEGLTLVAGGVRHRARRLVLATGSWGSDLLTRLGVRLEVQPVRGQMVALRPRGRPLPRIVFSDGPYALQKRSGLVLIGATEERAGFAAEPTLEGVQRLTSQAQALLPELGGARFETAWAGLRPFLEGGPVIGALPSDPRVLLALGHYRNGILLAPITAELVASALVDGSSPPELEPFSPGRRLAG